MLGVYKIFLTSVPQTEFVVLADITQVDNPFSGDDEWVIRRVREVSVGDVEVMHFISDDVMESLMGAILDFENDREPISAAVTV